MNVFQKIIAREIPAEIVFEDELCLAFLDIHPINPGHILLIPKEPVPNWQDLGDETSAHLFSTARKLARRIEQVYNPQKVGLMIAGFDVDHAHIHIFPAYSASDIPSSQDMSAEPDFPALSREATRLR